MSAYSLESDPLTPDPGDLVGGRYRVESAIAEGGHSVVFAARDVRTEQVVALKVLDPLLSRRPSSAARFERELRILARLRHPNTVRVHDAGMTADGCLYLAMEYLDGESLRQVLDRERRIAPERVARIAIDALRAIGEAHDHGVIHRDLKPANLFLVPLDDGTEHVKVLDFGIAKVAEDDDVELTQTGDVVCSPYYVAPERLRSRDASPASDLYSLGVILIEALEGRRPYEGETPVAISMQHASAVPVPMTAETVDGILGPVLTKATRKDPSKRYQSADEMRAALEAVLRGDGPARRPRFLVGAALAGVALVATIGLWTQSAPSNGADAGAPPASAITAAAASPRPAAEPVDGTEANEESTSAEAAAQNVEASVRTAAIRLETASLVAVRAAQRAQPTSARAPRTPRSASEPDALSELNAQPEPSQTTPTPTTPTSPTPTEPRRTGPTPTEPVVAAQTPPESGPAESGVAEPIAAPAEEGAGAPVVESPAPPRIGQGLRPR